MGKATINSAKGAGLYSIDIIYDTVAYDAQKTRYEAQIVAANEEILLAEEIKTSAENDRAGAYYQLQAAITSGDVPLSKEAERQLIEFDALIHSAKLRINIIKARRLCAEAGLQEILRTPADPRTVDAWCIDASAELTGTVGTIEIAGEEEKGVNIVAGFASAAYVPTRDGLLRKREHTSPAEAFWNGAMLPGWQKWTPTYRNGIITAMAGESCTVAIDAQTSTEQALNVNQTPLVTATFDYMDCHGDVFEVGDRIIVMFQGQEWTNAVVIGFESNPRPCFFRGLQVNDNGVIRTLQWQTDHWIVKNSAPLPIGTVKGNIDWQGNGDVLNWRGIPGRYWNGEATHPDEIYAPVVGMVFGTYSLYERFTPFEFIITAIIQPLPSGTNLSQVDKSLYIKFETFWRGIVWRNNKEILVENCNWIGGATVAGGKMIIIGGTTLGFGDGDEYLFYADLDGGNQRGGANIGSIYRHQALNECTPWFFNESGTRGVAVRAGRKYYLTIDPATETHVLTDEGVCQSLSQKSTYVRAITGGTTYDSGVGWIPSDNTLTTHSESTSDRAVFDFNGDVEVSLRMTFSSTSESSAFAASSGIGETTSTSVSSFSVELNGVQIITASGSASDAWLRTGDGDSSTHTKSSEAVNALYADLRLGLVVLHKTTQSSTHSDDYDGIPSTYSQADTSTTSLTGHFSNVETTSTLFEYGNETYINWEVFPSTGHSAEEALLYSGSGTYYDETIISPWYGTNSIAGVFASDPMTKKLAICVPQSLEAVSGDTLSWYTYLEGGALPDHTTIPCNPICAV